MNHDKIMYEFAKTSTRVIELVEYFFRESSVKLSRRAVADLSESSSRISKLSNFRRDRVLVTGERHR